jgi:hypothetical protein
MDWVTAACAIPPACFLFSAIYGQLYTSPHSYVNVNAASAEVTEIAGLVFWIGLSAQCYLHLHLHLHS